MYDLWSSVDAKAHPRLKRKAKRPLPHPGQSYNPRPEDHAKLINKVLKHELEFQKKARGCKIKIAPDELHRGEVQLGEDSDGSSTDDAYGEYEDKDFQVILKKHTVRENRKTPQQRLRRLKDKMQRKAAKLRRAKNIKLSKFDGLKKLVQQLDQKDLQQKIKAQKKHKNLKNQRLSQRLQLSDPIYCPSKELPSILRKIRCPMNAVVREQLESFQKRLMVEPSQIQTSLRRYKKKKFEKQGDQDQFDHVKGGDEMDDAVEGIDDNAAVDSDEEKTVKFV